MGLLGVRWRLAGLAVLGLILGLSGPVVWAQQGAQFSGNWRLNLQKSRLQVEHPPVASRARIEYDGVTWHYTRTHDYAARKPETWAIVLKVGAAEAQVEKDGPLTFRSKMKRDGDALVLTEEITASNGQTARNVARYSVADGGRTLVELEQVVTPSRKETNRWVFERVVAGK
jgi:hypothetical protein